MTGVRRGLRSLLAATTVGGSMAGAAASIAVGPGLAVAGGSMAAAATSAGALHAQEARTPEVVADEYLRGIEAMAWRATAQRIHPDALGDLRELLEILVERDRSGAILDALSGGRTAEEYFALDGRSLFVSVMRALADRSPGIVNAMTARSTHLLGTVAEGDTLRHAVYRLRWELSGATPEIKTLSLARDGRGRWRVVRAPELESIRPAVRGIRAPPPPPDSPSSDTSGNLRPEP